MRVLFPLVLVTAGGSKGFTDQDVYDLEGTVVLPNYVPLSEGRVYLDGDKLKAIPSKEGAFRFSNLSPGSYSLSIDMVGWQFPNYRVELGRDDTKVYYFGTTERVPTPLTMKPMRPVEYYQKPAGVNYM